MISQVLLNLLYNAVQCPHPPCDACHVWQVLLNLLYNAVKFTVNGGVDVDVEVGSASDSSYSLAVAVRDTGIGISEAAQKKVRPTQPLSIRPLSSDPHAG